MEKKTAGLPERERAREGSGTSETDYSGGFLTAEKLAYLLDDNRDEDLFFQLYVPADTGEYLLYVDTTTLQLHYGPPVPSVIDPRTNYSTIFIIKNGPKRGSYELFSYIISGNGPMAIKSSATTYSIKLNGSKGFYDYVYIEDKRGSPWSPLISVAFVTISIKRDKGPTIQWCPTSTNSLFPAERVIQGETGVDRSSLGDAAFLIRHIPKSIPIPPPIKESKVMPP